MDACYAVEFVTPKKVILNGLWFGPSRPRRVIVFIHGLTASAFSMSRLRNALIDPTTAVLTFNNRGFQQISSVKRKRGKKTEWVNAGAGREVFKESIDDVQGAVNFAKRAGAREIFLAGHSTGSQKAVYWARGGKQDPRIRGLILLGPLSDYAGTNRKYKRAVAYARALVRRGKEHELMPEKYGHWFLIEAQRFLSLYTPESVEEIFTYAHPHVMPRTLRSVQYPILALFAGADEHADRPAKEIAAWFTKHMRKGSVAIIPRVRHSFKGGERETARAIRKFMLQSRA